MGWGETIHSASGLNFIKSSFTALHKRIYASLLPKKYLVSGGSKKWGSWGMTLSRIEMTLQFLLMCLATNPCEGAKNGIQYLIISKSGANFLIFLAVLIYENGLIVSKTRMDSNCISESTCSTYCVFPGNNNPGYCLLKLNAHTSWSLLSSL